MSSQDNSIPLHEMSAKDKPWDTHKDNTEKTANLYELGGNSKYSLRLQNCAKELQFILQASSTPSELELKLSQAKFCRVKLCPICQWRRSLMWKAKTYKILPKLIEDYPTNKYILLTLTVKNCELEQLRYTIDWMNYAWTKLSRRKSFPAIGWIKSIEVTRANDGKVHPHIHALLAVKPSYFSGKGYIKHEQWQSMWRDCLKVDYLPVVDVRKVNDVLSSIPEILKYSTKESDYITDNPEYLIELTNQLHKCRMFNTGGILREYFASLEDDEDMIGSDNEVNLTEETMTFNWDSTNKQYITQ